MFSFIKICGGPHFKTQASKGRTVQILEIWTVLPPKRILFCFLRLDMDQHLIGRLSRVAAGENKNNDTCLFNKSFKTCF